MLRSLACLAIITSGLHAQAGESVATFKTASDAVLCLTADMLPQARDAAEAKDRDLMEQLGCFPIFANVPARRIDTRKGSRTWHVRLEPKGAEPMKVWGYNDAFRSDAGDKLDQDGRPEKTKP